MNEFLKLTWRKNITDEELDRNFLSDEAVADLYVYKSFDKPIKANKKKIVKLHLTKEKFVPGLKYHRFIKRRSLLTKTQKGHSLEAMKLIQSGKRQDLLTQKDKYSLKIYNECHSKIVEENRLFSDFIKNIWLKHKEKKIKLAAGISNFAWSNWKRRLARYLDYAQYYKEVQKLPLTFDENEATIDFHHVVQPLETGTLARYMQINLKEQCILKLNTLKMMAKQILVNSKLPVSQDENIPKLLENHNFDVAISSSALKQIIDYTNTNSKWIIPVIVKEIITESNGNKIKKRVVFIDKILPKVNPTNHDLKTYTYKRLLQLSSCQYEAFKYPIQECSIEQESENEEVSETESPESSKETKDKRFIHHNANYRVWNIKKITVQNTLMKNQVKDKEINLLVRCKLDACEESEQGVLYPVILRPKIEHQIQYGANIPSKHELARDWTSLFFHLYSVLYRARIYNPTHEVISVEKCSIQKINSEAHTHYNYKPILGLGVLQKILSYLVDLNCGNYLLQHLPKNEAFVTVMEQCDDDGDHAFDLHSECASASIDEDTRQNWLPIDVNYILPVHEEYNTIPGMFYGFDNNQNNKTGRLNKVLKGKNKKKKKKQT